MSTNKSNLDKFNEERHETAMMLFDNVKQEQEPINPELFDMVLSKGTDFITALKLYKDSLDNKGVLPLSVYREEIQNIKIIFDIAEEITEEMVSEKQVYKCKNKDCNWAGEELEMALVCNKKGKKELTHVCPKCKSEFKD